MEDINLGRETVSQETVVKLTATPVLLLPADNLRTAILISPPLTNRITLSFGSSPSDMTGIVMPQSGPPLLLDLIHHGEMVRKPIYAVAPFSTETIGVWTTHLSRETKF